MKITGLSGLLTGATDPDTGDSGYTASFTVNDVLVDTCAASVDDLEPERGGRDVRLRPAAGFQRHCTFRYRVNDSGNPAPAAGERLREHHGDRQRPGDLVRRRGGRGERQRPAVQPVQRLSAADAVDAANQSIFLYSGTYATGITLNTNEKLVGQGTTGSATFDALFGITPPAGTIARPAVATGTATVQNTVTLANTALLRGVALSTGGNTGLAGSGGLTNIDVAQTSVTTTTGTAVNLNNAAGTYSFSSISTNGAAERDPARHARHQQLHRERRLDRGRYGARRRHQCRQRQLQLRRHDQHVGDRPVGRDHQPHRRHGDVQRRRQRHRNRR